MRLGLMHILCEYCICIRIYVYVAIGRCDGKRMSFSATQSQLPSFLEKLYNGVETEFNHVNKPYRLFHSQWQAYFSKYLSNHCVKQYLDTTLKARGKAATKR